MLSALEHGHDANTARIMRIALAERSASVSLDADHASLYVDGIFRFSSNSARESLQTTADMQVDYEGSLFQQYIDGQFEGRASIMMHQLELRFGPVPEHVGAKLQEASGGEMLWISKRLLTARSLAEALGDL